jgi:hypothetical protein
MNNNLVLICGTSAVGKTASLRYLKKQEGVAYLNCENGKRLPFKCKFLAGEDGRPGIKISDPLEIFAMFTAAEEDDDVHTIIIDTATYMMDMYESIYVIGSTNTMQAWGEYAQFWKTLMRDYVGQSTKNVIMLAHTSDKVDADGIPTDHLVQIKGSIMKIGVESFFTTVVAAKKVKIKQLKKFKNDLLNISPEEEALGFKYVYQTLLTKETMVERIRAPFDMWTQQETFIDSDVQLVLDRFIEYYEDDEDF